MHVLSFSSVVMSFMPPRMYVCVGCVDDDDGGMISGPSIVCFNMNVLSLYLVLGFVGLINWLQFPYVQERPRTPILDMVLILYTRAPHRTNDDVYVLFSKGFSGFVTDRVGCVWCF